MRQAEKEGNIQSAGKVTAANALLGSNAGGAGTINVTGANSILEASTQIQVGLGGTGRLTISDGGNVSALLVTVGGASELSVQGVSVTGGVTLLNDSRMAVDNATVGPLAQQAGADLTFNLRGASDFDNLHVLGPASLQGDLFVTLGAGFSPQAGDSFEFLTSTVEINENFGSLNLPALSTGLEWQLDFSPQALTLTVIGSLPGDYNLDGAVDGADFLIWQRGFGSMTNLVADGNRDGAVDSLDYNIWRSNFGASANASLSTTGDAVPEPSSVAIVLLSLLGLVYAHRDQGETSELCIDSSGRIR